VVYLTDRMWKKVSDWGQPDPALGRVLVRHVTRPEVWIHYIDPDVHNTVPYGYGEPIPEDKEWVELDIPIGTSPPPPVDEKLDEEAWALFCATDPGSARKLVADWEYVSQDGKDQWRKVARKARELHAPQWRPMSELEDGHERAVVVRKAGGGPPRVLRCTYRGNDAYFGQIGWMELPS
jgi:hypothetical protein